MKKRAWITILEKNEGLGRMIFEETAKYGLNPAGHFWEDDLAKLAWAGAVPELTRGDCAVWLVVGQAASFAQPSIRSGLALLALSAQAVHGHDFPILLSPSGGKVDVASMPTPLRGVEVVAGGLGVKAVARANRKRAEPTLEYRLTVHPLPGLGLWFEVGPARDPWKGAFLGCTGADVAIPDAHGVGLAGTIPQNATLNYPVQGMKMNLGGREATAWGVHNDLSPAESYYVRIAGTPDGLVFGPFPDQDDVDAFTVSLV
ncbi:hypothetical protein [Desulfonatronum thioautotrophicum]|uniref:hypothetical protein n=1 Tax=Desulfonatronum thioautotrophicum TaxID=617001 RepID=UPI0005EB6A0C|nr:hypothetical protein [Desulfonatronum thioautotrophicum]